jgi:hypothetical protein
MQDVFDSKDVEEEEETDDDGSPSASYDPKLSSDDESQDGDHKQEGDEVASKASLDATSSPPHSLLSTSSAAPDPDRGERVEYTKQEEEMMATSMALYLVDNNSGTQLEIIISEEEMKGPRIWKSTWPDIRAWQARVRQDLRCLPIEYTITFQTAREYAAEWSTDLFRFLGERYLDPTSSLKVRHTIGSLPSHYSEASNPTTTTELPETPTATESSTSESDN